MSKAVKVQLEWRYSPSSYLEKPIYISGNGFTLQISQGVATATIEMMVFENNNSIASDLTKIIEDRLLAVQVLTHAAFTLSKPSRTDLKEDGTRNIFLKIEDAVTVMCSVRTVDIIMKDKDGNIISDSKRDRLERQEWFAAAIGKFRSSVETLDQMLRSQQMAVADPQNELVHLYEIRDALATKFKGHREATKQLHISEKEWKIIGNLANLQPLKQGRHRGKSVGKLRDANSCELGLARETTRMLIEKYLLYLVQRLKKVN